MTSHSHINPEWRAAGLVFRESFISQYLTRRNEVTLVNNPTISSGMELDGATQYVTYDGPKLQAIVGAANIWIMIRFDPDFAFDDGNAHILIGSAVGAIEIQKTVLSALSITLGGTAIAAIAGGTYGADWNVGQENTLIISGSSGDTSAWLNGTLILDGDATAWTPTTAETSLTVGSVSGGGSYFDGVIYEVVIGARAVGALEEADLRAEVTMEEIAPDQAVLSIPGKQQYERAADALVVTEAIGTSGVTEVLCGSDGATAAEFPAMITPRGFEFGASTEQLNAQDDAAFSFSSGGADDPMTIALMGSVDVVAGVHTLLSKAAVGLPVGAVDGEYYVYTDANRALYGQWIDTSVPAFDGRVTGNGEVTESVKASWVLPYSGGGDPGAAAEVGIYDNTDEVSTAASASGAYVGMEPGADDLLIAAPLTGVGNGLVGSVYAFSLYDFELSAAQARALSARMRSYERRA